MTMNNDSRYPGNDIHPSAPCRVKIIRCSFEQGWYRNLIGEEFDTDNAGGNYDYVVWDDYCGGHNGSWRHIAQTDCIRVPLTKQPETGRSIDNMDF
jgi:hypothetical protein